MEKGLDLIKGMLVIIGCLVGMYFVMFGALWALNSFSNYEVERNYGYFCEEQHKEYLTNIDGGWGGDSSILCVDENGDTEQYYLKEIKRLSNN